MSIAIFIILAVLITGFSLWAVTAKKMFRAATSLLFVLMATAGLYLLLDYHFLAMVQVAVYVGGVLVLFVFAILLTSNAQGDEIEKRDRRRKIEAVLLTIAGIVVTTLITAKHSFLFPEPPSVETNAEIPMQTIGTALIGSGKYEYLFAFEALSMLLLACVIGGIIIARKR